MESDGQNAKLKSFTLDTSQELMGSPYNAFTRCCSVYVPWPVRGALLLSRYLSTQNRSPPFGTGHVPDVGRPLQLWFKSDGQ